MSVPIELNLLLSNPRVGFLVSSTVEIVQELVRVYSSPSNLLPLVLTILRLGIVNEWRICERVKKEPGLVSVFLKHRPIFIEKLEEIGRGTIIFKQPHWLGKVLEKYPVNEVKWSIETVNHVGWEKWVIVQLHFGTRNNVILCDEQLGCPIFGSRRLGLWIKNIHQLSNPSSAISASNRRKPIVNRTLVLHDIYYQLVNLSTNKFQQPSIVCIFSAHDFSAFKISIVFTILKANKTTKKTMSNENQPTIV